MLPPSSPLRTGRKSFPLSGSGQVARYSPPMSLMMTSLMEPNQVFPHISSSLLHWGDVVDIHRLSIEQRVSAVWTLPALTLGYLIPLATSRYPLSSHLGSPGLPVFSQAGVVRAGHSLNLHMADNG